MSSVRHRFVHAVTALGLAAALGATAEAARAQPAPTAVPQARADLKVQQVRPSLYVLSGGGGGNVAVWSGPDGVVLVDDSTVAMGPQLLEAVGKISRGPVRFVINTHWHPDHTGGNEALARAGALIVAHETVRDRMSQPQSVEEYDLKVAAAPPAALPVVTFADALSLHLNGDRLDAIHVADAHTDGDVIVRWQAADVVHLGDVFDNAGYPFIDLVNGGSLAGTVAALEGTLARTGAQTVIIPGHGPVSNRAELAAYRDMLVAVGRKVREAVEQGKSLDEILAAHPTAEFDDRYGKGAVSADHFVRTLYRDLSQPRVSVRQTGRS